MSRLNPEAHPLSFINDDDVATSWISHVFTNITQLYEGVAISIDLENGQYQVTRDGRAGVHALAAAVK
jgi:usherin